MGGFQLGKWGTQIAGWFFLRENPIEMDDDWGYPYFGKPPNLDNPDWTYFGRIYSISMLHSVWKHDKT